MYAQTINFPLDRRFCAYCFGPATRRKTVIAAAEGKSQGLRIEFQMPVCDRCHRELSEPLSWDDIPQDIENLRTDNGAN